jgi:predicted phosphoribosyltransferase
MRLYDRKTAGVQLAQTLSKYSGSDTVVLALPRGGVVVGAELSKELHAPLDLVLVRKLTHPAFTEFAIGALAEGMPALYNASLADAVDDELRESTEKNARHLIAWRRTKYFSNDYFHPDIAGKIVIVADDGIATGFTMKAALFAVRAQRPRLTVVATPVASPEGIIRLGHMMDKIATLLEPDSFMGAVSMHYVSFPQIDDDTVKKILERSGRHVTTRQVSTIHP